MSSLPVPPVVIEGRVVHKKSNALHMAFNDGPGEPFAVAVQGAGDSKASKLGILFGFKNGGSGNHLLTYRDGSTVAIASKKDGAPSVLTHSDGTVVATIQRAATSSAILSNGEEVFRFLPDPAEAKTLELFRLLVTTPTGGSVGRLDVIRQPGGWTLEAVVNDLVWWGQAGQPLDVPILGTRLTLDHPITGVDRDILLGACVDIAIGLRPYTTEMK